MKTLNIAVVGCGYWGPNLARNFAALPGCRLTWVCDASPQRTKHLKRLYPSVKTSASFQALLDDPNLDAIAVATPVRLHYALARRSLLAGKHTFIEKPMASSSRQCLDLVRIARKKRLALMVGHTYLYSPAVRRIKEIIDAGEIGEVRYISSRRLNLGLFQKDINVVWDLAPHDLSIILYLVGKSSVAINCQGQAHVAPGIEDVASLSLTFAGGSFAMVHSSWLDPKKVREMTIVGSLKMITYDDVEPLHKIRIYDQRVSEPPHYDTFAEFHYSYHYGDVHVPYLKQEEPLKVECQHFVDCIAKGTQPLSSGDQGVEVVRILEAADESLRHGGGSVTIPRA